MADEDYEMGEDPVASAVHDTIGSSALTDTPRSLVTDTVIPAAQEMHTRYLLQIIEEYLGPVAHSVAEAIFTNGLMSFKALIQQFSDRTAAAVAQYRAAMRGMLQHGVLRISVAASGEYLYDIDGQNVEGLVRYGKYVLMLQKKDGTWFEAGTIVEAFAEHGRLSRAKAIDFAVQREKNVGGTGGDESRMRLSKAFSEMVKFGFLKKVDLIMFEDQFLEGTEGKKAKSDPAEKEMWTICHDRFILEFRILFLQDYVCGRVDATASKIVRSMMEPSAQAQTDLSKLNGIFSNFSNFSVSVLFFLEYSEIALYDSLPKEKISVTRQGLRGYIDELLNDSVPILRYKDSFGSGEVMYVGMFVCFTNRWMLILFLVRYSRTCR